MRRAEAEAVPTMTNPSQGLHSSPNPSTTMLQPEQSLSLSRLSSLLVQMRGLGGEGVGELCTPLSLGTLNSISHGPNTFPGSLQNHRTASDPGGMLLLPPAQSIYCIIVMRA